MECGNLLRELNLVAKDLQLLLLQISKKYLLHSETALPDVKLNSFFRLNIYFAWVKIFLFQIGINSNFKN